MVEFHWADLEGREVRYRDHTWELTGDLEIFDSGEQIAVDATQADDVRHGAVKLHFDLEDPPDSLNPGNLGEYFDRIERTDDGQFLVVKAPGKTYRYRLHRLEYE